MLCFEINLVQATKIRQIQALCIGPETQRIFRRPLNYPFSIANLFKDSHEVLSVFFPFFSLSQYSILKSHMVNHNTSLVEEY